MDVLYPRNGQTVYFNVYDEADQLVADATVKVTFYAHGGVVADLKNDNKIEEKECTAVEGSTGVYALSITAASFDPAPGFYYFIVKGTTSDGKGYEGRKPVKVEEKEIA